MPLVYDQTGYVVDLPDKPQRVVSLVPSQSELLWELGLKNERVGITKFCIHPDEMYKSVTRVGGTKKVDIEKIRMLKPDLIIGNYEENTEKDIVALRQEFPVFLTDVRDLYSALFMMRVIGEIFDKSAEVKKMSAKITRSMEKIKGHFEGLRVAYLIWKDPYMAAAVGTFIHSVLIHAGLRNVFYNKARYPEISLELLKKRNPKIVFLSSEPYPFKEKHVEEIQTALPKSKVILVDGEMFSWYGSRLLKTADYLKSLKLE